MRPQLIALTIAALIGFGAAIPEAEAAGDRHDRHGWDRGHDRRGDHGSRHDRRHDDRARHHRRDDRAYYRSGYHEGYRDGRRSQPYVRVVHHRPGPPPHAWARGQRYRDYYSGPVYVVHDYPRYHLRRPPHGHHWVRDDRGNMLLVAVATGIIADLMLHH